MSQQTLCVAQPEQARAASLYTGLSLADLAGRIACESDRLALREFHEGRPLFRRNGGGPMLFAEFVDAMRQAPLARRLAGSGAMVLDRAYDLTIDKFTNLPRTRGDGASRRRRGPDCRCYFRRFLDQMERWQRDNQATNALRTERAAATIMQRCVVNDFCLSCLEAKRQGNRAMSRYAWHVNGRVIRLWMPASMSGRQRRPWLERYVTDPDPSRPGERERVQAIVDAYLGKIRDIPLSKGSNPLPARHPDDAPLNRLLQHEVTAHGLAEVVADEKVMHLDQQRP
ncbi:MAG: hypothetical protein ABIH17_03600, partial [Pseudomonadota bacterium]